MQKRNVLAKVSNDEQKIENRIRLLRQEESKILKSVDETQSRAARIYETKKRNEARYIEKLR